MCVYIYLYICIYIYIIYTCIDSWSTNTFDNRKCRNTGNPKRRPLGHLGEFMGCCVGASVRRVMSHHSYGDDSIHGAP